MNFERWDIVLFQNIYSSDFKMEIWKVYNIKTFMYQPEGSNFKPYPFFNWTQDKGSCITCKKEISQKSFADHRLYRVLFLTIPTKNVKLHSKSSRKSSRCQNLPDWHLELFGWEQLKKAPCTYMQEEAKSQSFSHLGYYHQSRFLSEADLSPFQRDCSCLEHISVPCG